MIKKATLLILTTLFLNSKADAQFDSLLFGIARHVETDETYLSTINAETGELNIISPQSISATFMLNSLAVLDPYQDIFYFQDIDQFYSVDLNTGATIAALELTAPFPFYFDYMHFNCADSTIYGLARNADTQQFFLSKLNPTTAEVIIISQEPLEILTMINGLSAIDPFQEIFYIQNFDGLLGIDLNTGEVIADVELTLPLDGYFDLMQYNPENGTFYGVLRTSGNEQLYLSKIDVTDGEVTLISPTSFGSGFWLNALSTIDTYHQIYYLHNYEGLIGLSLETGEVISQSVATVPDTYYFDFMRFYSPSCSTPAIPLASAVRNSANLVSYPNPGQQSIHISFENPESLPHKLQVLNIFGQSVAVYENLTSSSIILDASAWEGGAYYLKLTTPDGNIISGKLHIF